MQDVAFRIDHNIPVVTIFKLQEICDDRVRSHASDEVVSSGLKLCAVRPIVFAHEVLVKAIHMFTTEHIP